MRLRELHIKNFRKIEDLKIAFPPGLCVLVGENNVGKTAIIDALRLMLFSGREFDALRVNEDDFRVETNYTPIEVSCTFCDQTDEDEVHFQECLVDVGNGKFEIKFNARFEFNEETRRPKVRTWGGEIESGRLSSDVYDHLASVYLQPLRNPETSLRPGRHSQVSRLVDTVTEKSEHGEFEAIASDANVKLRDLAGIKNAKNDLNAQMLAIAGPELTQNTELVFADPTFHRIIAELQPEIEGLPFLFNGLGYNNLIFTSATLGTLRRSPQFSFRSILVEEPEAHLHPQLQVLLLQYFAQITGFSDNKVQVIASTHSPILASQAPIDSMVVIQENDGALISVCICAIAMDSEMKRKLERFLDATRSELFFARRILMVEGISEALLLPVLTRLAGGDLKKSAVTVVNAHGLNFDCFIPLFGASGLACPVAILTDGDAESIGGEISRTAAQLKAAEGGADNLRVEYCERTFEHELARSSELLPLMLDAFEKLHPVSGASLKTSVTGLGTQDAKADAFLTAFLKAATSKGVFAQELAAALESSSLTAMALPDYVLRALQWLSVIGTEPDDDTPGNTEATDPSAEAD